MEKSEPEKLCEILRPKSSGLTANELQVYEDFDMVPDYFIRETTWHPD